RWRAVLRGLLEEAHPLHREICRPIAQDYYWTASATEYATDVMFADAPSLAAIYPRLVHHGLRTFSSPDVMRFLGHKTTSSGRLRRGQRALPRGARERGGPDAGRASRRPNLPPAEAGRAALPRTQSMERAGRRAAGGDQQGRIHAARSAQP